MNNLISIISPVYNSEKFLNKTITSVLDQSCTNWELILIDDFSTDHSKTILEEFRKKDDRIRLIYLEENRGAGYSRNVGLENAKGDYIAFLDSDDYWHKDKLKQQFDFIKKSNAKIVYSWYYNINEIDVKKSYFVTPKKINFNLLKFNNYILTSTLLLERAAFKEIRFSEIRKRQDWIYFLDLLKTGETAYAIQKCLVYYRKSSNSLSANKLKLVKSNLSVIKDYFYKGNKFYALLHFLVFLTFYFHNKIFYRKKIT